MKRNMPGLGFAATFLLTAACGSTATPATEAIAAGAPAGTPLVLDVRVFDAAGVEVPCTADLELTDVGREGGGAHELALTACHETLDGSARAYGSYRFEYTVPQGGPRYLRARSLAGAPLAPPEFTVQIGVDEDAGAWRSLSVAYTQD